ncbi:MAG: phosphate ABC transporter permease subunit PstC, partial [Erythrobacter sp.]|nr:phosphate ABC transporter permease subunit PstC [Erythrobacter sp.]
MSPITLILIAIGLGLLGWLAGRAKAWSFQTGDAAMRPASRPIYHAWYVALWVVLPVLAFVAAWSVIAPNLVLQSVLATPEAQSLTGFDFERNAFIGEARAVALGQAPGVFNTEAEPLIAPFRDAFARYNTIGIIVTVLIALAGGALAFLRLKPQFGARTKVERTVLTILLLASLVAILTTLGIFASLV